MDPTSVSVDDDIRHDMGSHPRCATWSVMPPRVFHYPQHRGLVSVDVARLVHLLGHEHRHRLPHLPDTASIRVEATAAQATKNYDFWRILSRFLVRPSP